MQGITSKKTLELVLSSLGSPIAGKTVILILIYVLTKVRAIPTQRREPEVVEHQEHSAFTTPPAKKAIRP